MYRFDIATRSSSDNVFPFRKRSRFEFVHGAWYFSTREGLEGPYATRHEAETEAMLFIRQKLHLDDFGLTTEQRAPQAI